MVNFSDCSRYQPAGTKRAKSTTFPEFGGCNSDLNHYKRVQMSRYSQANLLLHNRYTRTIFLQHVIGDSTTLDARRFRALGREFQNFEGITHEAAGQQEEQRVVDYQILLGPERKN